MDGAGLGQVEDSPVSTVGDNSGGSPVVSGVPDGSLATQSVALLQVKGVLSVGVVARPQLLGRQISLVVESAQQVAVQLCPRRMRHLQKVQQKYFFIIF